VPVLVTGVEAISAYESARSRGAGVQLGWPVFDAASGGLYPGSVTVIGAESSVGKTFSCLSLALDLATRGLRPLLIETEDGVTELGKRLATTSPPTDVAARIGVDCVSGDLASVVASIESGVEAFDVLFLDYLQDIVAPGASVQEQVLTALHRVCHAAVSRPFVICSQLTDRFGEDAKGAPKEPDIRQLRYCKDIRTKATHVVLLWNDAGVIHARHAKNKTGPGGGRWQLRRRRGGLLEPVEGLWGWGQ